MYNNIQLIPRKLSTIDHRSDVDLSTQFGKHRLNMPILHSPMDTIGSLSMADLFTENKLIGCFPRQNWKSISIPINNFIKKYPSIISVGLEDSKIATEDLYTYSNVKYFLIDIANGFNKNVEPMTARLKSYPDTFVIAGNVASAEGYMYLADLGVDAVRVGIGVGSVCKTTVNTGIGCNLINSIIECHEASLEMKKPPLIIADGGIKTVGEIAKLLAIGADVVMLGGMFAGTTETSGKVIVHNKEKYKLYHGSASYASQVKYKNIPYYIEGEEILIKYKGTAQKILDKIDAGLRSSFSYMDARTIEEFKCNCRKVI